MKTTGKEALQILVGTVDAEENAEMEKKDKTYYPPPTN